MSGLKSVRSRTVDDHIQRTASRCLSSGLKSQIRLADIAVYHFDALAQKFRETVAVALGQSLKDRRFFQNSLKTLHRGRCFVVPDQQIDPPNLRQISQQAGQPHFADEARRSDQQDVFASQRLARA